MGVSHKNTVHHLLRDRPHFRQTQNIQKRILKYPLQETNKSKIYISMNYIDRYHILSWYKRKLLFYPFGFFWGLQ